MRDAIAALEAALSELVEARDALPEDLSVEVEQVITQTRNLLDSLRTKTPDAAGNSEGND